MFKTKSKKAGEVRADDKVTTEQTDVVTAPADTAPPDDAKRETVSPDAFHNAKVVYRCVQREIFFNGREVKVGEELDMDVEKDAAIVRQFPRAFEEVIVEKKEE